MEADEVKTFASLAEESSKRNHSDNYSMKQPEIQPSFSVTILGVLCNPASIVTSPSPISWWNRLMTQNIIMIWMCIMRDGKPAISSVTIIAPENDYWRLSQKDLPAARSRVDQIHS
jgi:hypothetical protein